MESTTDFDLEELESRLYSQVFHSTEQWDKQSASFNLNNVQTRHVSPYAVSNTPITGNRYWDAKNNANTHDTTQNIDQSRINSNENTLHAKNDANAQDKMQNIDQNRINSNENTFHEHNTNESIITESSPVQSTSCQQNCNKSFPDLESIIPIENIPNHEYSRKPLMYKHYLIPPTLKLPKSKAKRMPRGIIKYFQLKGSKSFKHFRSFLHYMEKLQGNNNTKTDSSKNNSADQSTINIEKSSPKITVTINGIDKQIQLSDIPISVKDDSSLPSKNKELENNDNDIIILSDSDSDSVIEIPLPPIPVYNVDSSSESELEEIEIIPYKIPFSPKNKGKIAKYVNPAAKAQQNLAKGVKENIGAEDHFNDNSTEHSLQDCEIQLENINQNPPVDMNISFTELEEERDDFLYTPDTNDFLENDVSSLSKNSLSFNFGLHSSDLDLSKDKDEPSKSGSSAIDHDLYETESSCSEMGSVISKSRPVFNEINFESPIKDIFCEPNLSKFSNFITPNRNMQRNVKQSEIRSNLPFAPIQTKARGKKVGEEEMRAENKRRSRSDSSEYHSDATTLRIKKKNKKAKKKAKKKERLENKNVDSPVSPSPEELQTMEFNPESELVSASSPQLQTEDSIPKSNVTAVNSQNTDLKSNSNEIGNLKYGPNSNTIVDLENNKIQTTPENSKQENSKSPRFTESTVSRCSTDSNYYFDTYFADDYIVLDEMMGIEKQNENTENNMEVLDKQETNTIINEIETSSTNIATITNEIININESIPINKETTVKLSNDLECLSPGSSENGVNFSFVDTWRKSTDKVCSSIEKQNGNKTENEITPSKRLKTHNSPTVHPYVVTIESSDDDSNSSVISVGRNEENISRTITVVDLEENSCPDLIVLNVQNDKTNVVPASKISSKKNIVANPFSFVNTYLQNIEKKSFKDFYTNDLKQFYDESWGQENFDLEKVQSSMSGNSSDWKVIPTDLINQRSRKGKGPYCKRCRDWGHTQFNCPNYRGPICSTCGSSGHWYSRCPQSFCTTCRNPSIHYTTKCRFCAHFRTVQCNLCCNVGHEMKFCPDLWRRYHLTTESHTELNTSSSVLKSPNERWCSNCAKRGHCEDKCTYFRHEHFPTTPGIISYVPTYDDVFKLPLLPAPPNIPIFKDANVTIADLRTMKNDIIYSSNKKYMNILKQLRQRCNKYDFQLINQIDRLQRNLHNQTFSKKQIQEIHRIRARVTRYKIS